MVAIPGAWAWNMAPPDTYLVRLRTVGIEEYGRAKCGPFLIAGRMVRLCPTVSVMRSGGVAPSKPAQVPKATAPVGVRATKGSPQVLIVPLWVGFGVALAGDGPAAQPMVNTLRLVTRACSAGDGPPILTGVRRAIRQDRSGLAAGRHQGGPRSDLAPLRLGGDGRRSRREPNLPPESWVVKGIVLDRRGCVSISEGCSKGYKLSLQTQWSGSFREWRRGHWRYSRSDCWLDAQVRHPP